MTGHELLAPAGSLEICKAVLASGADAVYLGGDKFGARAFAKNFTQDDIFEALDYAHLFDKKIFLTVNTLLKNREIGRELYDYLKPLYCHGLDAIIVQDYGVFQFVRRYFPELPIHVSTQMSVSNVYGAQFLKDRGATRIVTARELSLEEIHDIYEQTGVEIESFVHGALCYCYSGQCLMSSMLGGRSGNRGRCAQPCRLAYQVLDEKGQVLHKQEKFPLSPKDLCTITLLPKLCEAGIYSFKIEGRMKQLEYAAGVTQIYRKYLDLYETNPKDYRVEDADIDYLMQMGNRNGFTKGYYEMRNGREMMTLTDSSHSSSKAKQIYTPKEMKKIPISGEAVFQKGMPAVLKVSYTGMTQKDISQMDTMQTNSSYEERIEITTKGAEVSEALNRAATKEEVHKRLMKTGETPFEFQSLNITMDEDIFLPVKQLNELRRDALEQLQTQLVERHRREIQQDSYKMPEEKTVLKESCSKNLSDKQQPTLNVQICAPWMLDEVLKYSFVDMITLDFTEEIAASRARIQSAGKQAALCFPYVFRKNSVETFVHLESELVKFDKIWVRSYDSLGFVLQIPGIRREQIALDFNLYVYSTEAANAFALDQIQTYTASLELNKKELKHMPQGESEFLLYGSVPLMISAQCVYKNYDQCYKNNDTARRRLYLKDRYFKEFFIKRNCKDCYNVIYNSCPVSLFHQGEEVHKLSVGSYRISFVQEQKKEIQRILQSYEQAFVKGVPVSAPDKKDAFTNGHFGRGVE